MKQFGLGRYSTLARLAVATCSGKTICQGSQKGLQLMGTKLLAHSPHKFSGRGVGSALSSAQFDKPDSMLLPSTAASAALNSQWVILVQPRELSKETHWR